MKAFDKVRAGLEFAAGPDRTQTDVEIWTLEFGIVLDALAMLESDIYDLLETQEPETDEEIDAVLVGAGFNPSDVAVRMRDFAACVLEAIPECTLIQDGHVGDAIHEGDNVQKMLLKLQEDGVIS